VSLVEALEVRIDPLMKCEPHSNGRDTTKIQRNPGDI